MNQVSAAAQRRSVFILPGPFFFEKVLLAWLNAAEAVVHGMGLGQSGSFEN